MSEESEEREAWRDLGWDSDAARPSWPDEVVAALRQNVDGGGPMIEDAALTDLRAVTFHGVPAVEVVYDHPYHPRGPVGLRVRIDQPPLGGAFQIGHGESAVAKFADFICYLLIGEPPGTRQDGFVGNSDGVWWWGFGLPVTD